MSLDADICHAAVEARDRRFDGRFYIGVTSTGIYCRCICPARTPKRENRTFHRSAAAAEAAGFRPCLICRPELAPGFAPIDAPARLASQAYARIEAGALEERGLAALAGELGVTDRHLRRVMSATYGASPIDLAQTSRLLTARRLLLETGLSITEVAFAAGYQSLRRFNASMKQRYGMSPSQMRGNRAPARAESFSVKLAARGKLDLAPTFAFLAMRALPGVEIGGADFYRRVIKLGDAVGWLDVRVHKGGVVVTMSENLAPSLRQIVSGVRGAFDLDADIDQVDDFLAADARFAPDVGAEPAVRIAGALDGFETAVRAVLGQQVSVRAARTFGSRLAERFGAKIEGAPEGLTHAFPHAAALAQARVADIAAIGLTGKRAETLSLLAKAVASGDLTLARGAIAAGREGLARIPGIGPWTIDYIALRALGDPDAFPPGDVALIAALGGKSKADTLESLRPWRGYAAIRLWRRAATKELRT